MDDLQAVAYRFEQQSDQLFRTLTVLGIILALLGLYGMSSYTAIRRTKEISIRKVLGASLPQLFKTLTSGIVGLVILGVILAVPLAWWLMDQWLQGFASRTTVHWSIFLGIAMVQLALAYATMAYHSLKVARINPSLSLRSE